MRASPNEGQLYYITAATERRVPCLADETAGPIILSALDFYRTKHRLEVHAWVIMPDHIHLLASLPAPADMADLVARLKSWTAKSLVQAWSESGRDDLLQQLRLPDPKPKRHSYRIWGRGSCLGDVYTPRMARQKIRYIHSNPEAAGLAPSPADWPYSDYQWWALGKDVLLNPNPIDWLYDPVY